MSHTLVRMFHGSHLYGTATPDSDVDYKGVALASPTDVLMGRIPKIIESHKPRENGEKNQPGDIDLQVFSLHHFMKLALAGETVAVDMLHATIFKCQFITDAWIELRNNRHRFYTRSMKSLVGYARAQAAKYGLRGSRLANARILESVLSELPPRARISEHADALPDGEHCGWDGAGVHSLYELCGMLYPPGAKVEYVLNRVRAFIDKYGSRAKLAESNQGVDWKAISHAFRAAYQLRSILLDGGFEYPLVETQHLRDVKAGVYTYKMASIELEELIEQVERLVERSSLPDQPDTQWADEYLMRWTRGSLTTYLLPRQPER